MGWRRDDGIVNGSDILPTASLLALSYGKLHKLEQGLPHSKFSVHIP